MSQAFFGRLWMSTHLLFKMRYFIQRFYGDHNIQNGMNKHYTTYE